MVSYKSEDPAFVVQLVFLSLSVVILGYGCFSMYSYYLQSDWPSTQGIVVKASISERVRKKQPRRSSRSKEELKYYMPLIEYKYEVSGKQYVNDDIATFYEGCDTNLEATSVINRYEAGKTVTVYFDPNRPGKSVLDNSFSVRILKIMASGLFVMFVTFIIGKFKTKKALKKN